MPANVCEKELVGRDAFSLLLCYTFCICRCIAKLKLKNRRRTKNNTTEKIYDFQMHSSSKLSNLQTLYYECWLCCSMHTYLCHIQVKSYIENVKDNLNVDVCEEEMCRQGAFTLPLLWYLLHNKYRNDSETVDLTTSI